MDLDAQLKQARQDLDKEKRLADYERLKELASEKFKDKKYVEAIKYYNEAATAIFTEGETNPNKLSCYVVCKSNAAQCCINFNNFKGAIKYATEALTKDPKNIKSLYRRGISHNKMYNGDEAMDDLKAILSIDPNNKEAEKEIKRAATVSLLKPIRSQGPGDKERIASLLQMGADINDHSMDNGDTFLMIACTYSIPPVCSISDKNLSYAGIKFSEEIIEYMVNRGANVNDRNNKGCSALLCAATAGNLQVVEFLLSKGAGIHDTMSHSGYSSLMCASDKGFANVIKLLLSKGAKITDRDLNGNTPLIVASMNGHPKAVELLISRGAGIHDRNNEGAAPIYMASENRHLDVVKLLASKGANIHDRNNSGYSCIFASSRRGSQEVTEFLLSKGANVNDKEPGGTSPVLIASQNGHVDVVRVLVAKGARINDKDNGDGFSCIMAASQEDHVAVVELLLSKGADINDRSSINATPVLIASSEGCINVVRLLLSKGANLHDRNNQGCTSIMMACANGHFEVAKLLLTKGANWRDCLSDGITSTWASTKSKDIRLMLKRWDASMLILMLKELRVMSYLEPSLVLEFQKFVGLPELNDVLYPRPNGP